MPSDGVGSWCLALFWIEVCIQGEGISPAPKLAATGGMGLVELALSRLLFPRVRLDRASLLLF